MKVHELALDFSGTAAIGAVADAAGHGIISPDEVW